MKKCFRILSVVLAGAMLLSTSALACTGVYVGKDVSDQGTYIIARSEDQAQSDYNKMFMVQPRVDNVPGRTILDTATGFEIPLPDTTYKYTYVPDYTRGEDGMYPGSCTNEYGVSITATVSTSTCDAWREADPFIEPGLREAILAAQKSDVVILCMGLNPTIEGEEGDAYNGDMSGDKTSLDLPASQEALIEEILKVGKPTVFLNVTGSCVNLTREDQACDAVLQVFYPGAEGGKAVADILYGKVSPSGRLPVTFYHNDSELPRFTDYSMKGRTYKYFQGKPLYPFAHGLSYTEFAYENLAFDGANVTGTVKNTGAMASGHAIPVFVKDPEEEGVNCRLAGFARVELEPGQETGFQVELCPEILGLFQEPQRLVALVGGVDGCQVNQ